MTQRRMAAITWEQEASSWDEVHDSGAGVGQVEWLRPGEQVARYEVEAKLGEGGVAVVYRVRHLDLGAHYAIKVVKRPRPELLARLYQEGRLLAKLNHPHVVRVIDVLEVRGALPALVMDYVEGQPLSARLSDPALGLAQKLAWFEQVVEAISCAHAHGVVHRDIKPANVLIGARADGALTAYVTDFGIAKFVQDPESYISLKTETGQLLGTPYYMAPEQLMGSARVDHRADIFSLGVMLYELCCGRRPFEGASLVELFKAIEGGAYVSPGELAPTLPGYLEPIIARCLLLDPEQRWGSCEALLAALREPAQAQTPVQVMAQPGAWRLGALGAAVVMVGLGAAWAYARQDALSSSAAASAAAAALELSEARTISSEQVSALMAAGWQRAEHEPGEALALLRAAESLKPGVLRLQDLELLRRRGAAAQIIPMGAEATALSLSPDGRYAATLDLGQRLRVVELERGQLKWSRQVTEKTAAWMLDYSPLGSYLLGYTRAGITQGVGALAARQYDAQDGEALRTMGHGKGVYGIAFDPGERWMVTRSDEAELIVWELGSGTPRARLEVGAIPDACMGFSGDGRYLVAVGAAYTLFIFDAQTWALAGTVKLPQAQRGTCLLSAAGDDPDAMAVYSAGALWRLSVSARRVQKIADYSASRPRALAMWRDRVVVGGNSEPVERFVVGEPAGRALEVHDARVMSWAMDARLIATASTDGSVGVWSLDGELLQRWYGPKSWMLSAKLTKDASHVVVTTRDGKLVRWAADHVYVPQRLAHAPAQLARWWWSGSGRAGLAQDREGALWRWRLDHGFERLDLSALSVSILDDGASALLKGHEGAMVLSLEDGEVRALPGWRAYTWGRYARGAQGQLYGIEEGLRDCKIWQQLADGSPTTALASLDVQCGHIMEDGRGGYFVFGRGGEVFRVGDDGRVEALDVEAVDGISQVAVSEARGVIAVARWRGGVRLLRRDDLSSVATLQEHAADGAHRVEVSPDGQRFATAGLDRTVRIWRASDGALLHTFAQPAGEVIALRFVQEGRALVASTKARMVWRWDVDGGELLWAAQTQRPLQALREVDGQLIGVDEGLGVWRFAREEALEPLLVRSGRWSNLRVCRDALKVVAVVPYPAPESVWAPASSCAAQVVKP